MAKLFKGKNLFIGCAGAWVLLLVACNGKKSSPDSGAFVGQGADSVLAGPAAGAVGFSAKALWDTFRPDQDAQNQNPYCSDALQSGSIVSLVQCIGSRFTPVALQQAAGMSMFVDGPHTETQYDLSNTVSFGRYNPKFVSWAREQLLKESVLKQYPFLRDYYTSHLQDVGRKLYLVYYIVSANEGLADSLIAAFRTKIAKGTWCVSDRSEFLVLLTSELDKTHIGKNYRLQYDERSELILAFWLRRMLDGTHKQFHEALLKALQIFDPEFYSMWLSTPHYQIQCNQDNPFTVPSLRNVPSAIQERLQTNLLLVEQFSSLWQDICPSLAVSGSHVRLFAQSDIEGGASEQDLLVHRAITGVGGCSGDTTSIFFNDKSIRVDNELSFIDYLFNGHAKLGIRNGMSMEEVEKLLGTPARKNAHFLTYLSSLATEEMHGDSFVVKQECLVLFFVNNALVLIRVETDMSC